MHDGIEQAQEGIEHAHHHASVNPGAKLVAVLIAILAASLAIFETAEKGAQNLYLTHHISLSDDYNFYQAKNVRASLRATEATVLASLPNASDPAIQQKIDAATKDEARLRDDPGGEGMKQLLARAKEQTAQRDEAFHHYHILELVVGVLQIAIVLASVSIVTSMRILAWVGAGLGALAVVGAIALTMV